MAPKTYFAFDNDSESFKRSSKEIQHRIEVDYQLYYNVLYNNTPHQVQNNIIRLKNGEMCSFKVSKTGITDHHVKNYVEFDRVSTKPFPENH